MTTRDVAIEMFVGGLVVDKNTESPVVILRDEGNTVTLPIWIGMAEATSIASALNQITPSRPLSHDLMHTIVNEVGARVQRVVITDLKDATFFSELVLSLGDREIVIDARPSDALALALRDAAPIFVHRKVLDVVHATVPSPEAMPISEEEESAEEPKEKEDKGGAVVPGARGDFAAVDKKDWEKLLKELDPDDFKYKV